MTASVSSVFAAICNHSRPFRFSIAVLPFLLSLFGSPVAAQTLTTISGTVYDPSGALPLSNVLVYVTTVTVVPPLTPGALCMSTPVATPMVSYTYTAVDGTFTLSNVPENTSYTLVIQAGKWRRQFSDVAVATSPLTGLSFSMPSTHAQGDIPLIAITTGKDDAMECVLRNMGIADSEFTDDNNIINPGGRIHLYLGDNDLPTSEGAVINASTPLETALMSNSTRLDSYDMVMFPCQSFPINKTNHAAATNLLSYANTGGRVFTTHFSYDRLDTDSPYDSLFLPPVAIWDLGQPDPNPDSGTATINTSFPEGATFAQWLQLPIVGAANAQDQIQMSSGLRHDLDSDSAIAPTQSWLTLNDPIVGNPVIQLSFDTPIGVPAASQCGRVLYYDYHVIPASVPNGTQYPNECPVSTAMNPQEKVLEYALFDQPTLVSLQAVITWPPPAAITYGTPLSATQLDATFTGLAGIPLTGTVAYTPPAGTVLPAGLQTLSVSFTPDDPTYAPASASVTLQVNPATLTVTANNASRAYGAPNPTFTDVITGFVNGDTSSVLSGAPSLTTTATTTSMPGTYPIIPELGTLSAANYDFIFVNGTLTVTQANQTISCTPPVSPVTYGVAPISLSCTATSTLPVSYSVLSGPGTIFGNSLTITGAGTVVVAANQTGNTDYAAAAQVTESITVNPATLTVTATNTSRAYGAANPTFTDTITGFVNNDPASVVSGSASLTTTAILTSAPGSYPIIAALGSLSAANYNFIFVNGTLTVTTANQTITCTPPISPVTYGVAPISLSCTATSTLPVSYSVVSGPGTISLSTLTITGAGTVVVAANQAGNDNYTAAAQVTESITVNPATLTVTVANANRVYGAPNPTFTDAITGFVNGDPSSVVSGAPSLTTTATATSAPGSYPITAALGSLSAANYNFIFINGTLTVSTATQTITFPAPASPVTYGIAPISLSATATSTLPVSYSVLSGPGSITGNTLTITGVGTVVVAANQAGNANYTAAAQVTESITVNPATLTVTANNISRAYGAANPTLTDTITGFVNGDTSSVLSGAPSLTTTATTTSMPGTYPITTAAGTLSAANYNFIFVNGTLTVTTANQTITCTPPVSPVTYGVAPITLSCTATSTLTVSYSVLSGPGSISGSTLTITGAGTVLVAANQAGNTDYAAAAQVTESIAINPATPPITWPAPAPITYGTPLSATQLDATSTVAGSFAYSPGPGTVLGGGPNTLTATFTPTYSTGYTTSTATVSLTVLPVTPLVALTSSVNPVFTSNPVTFTAILTGPAGAPSAPSGTVTFLDGTTPLGSGAVTAGVATLTVAAPATGTHSITAVFSGDTNYTPAISSPLSETIQDFTIALPPGAAGTVTAPPAGLATYPLVITSLGGSLPAPVSLTVIGLPPGMTSTFSTNVVATGSTTANVTLQVSLPGYSALQPPPSPFGGRSLPLALGLILLPYAGRLRKTAHRFRKLAVLALAGAALAVGVTGCQTTFTPKTFPLTVTATSGSLTHTTTVNIIVQ